MRYSTKWITAVLIILVVGLVASVAAQKGKPAPTPTVPRWTLEIQGAPAGQGIPTIFGGSDVSQRGVGVVYDPAVTAAVQTGASYSSTTFRGAFSLYVNNLTPTVQNDKTGLEAIKFENIQFDTVAPPRPLKMGSYSAVANKLGPYFDANNNLQFPPWGNGDADPTGIPTYQAEFLNSAPHPRLYYKHVSLGVSYSGPSFLDLGIGDDAVEVLTSIRLQVPTTTRECAAPAVSGIGLNSDLPFAADEPNTIRRTGENEWTIQANQRIYMYQYGEELVARTWAKKTVYDCTWVVRGGWWTTPVRFTMIVRRITS